MIKRISIILSWVIFSIPVLNAQLDETVNQPLKNFGEFWQLFDKNYASFEEKNINWDSIGRLHQQTIHPNTSNKELFHVFCEMIKPLEDSHVSLIVKKADTKFSAEKSTRLMTELKPHIKGKVRKKFDEMVEATLHKNDFKNIKSLGKSYKGIVPLFLYGDNGKIGYLRIGRCFSSMLIKKGIGLNKKLNTIFNGFSKKIASRLTDKKIIGYYKQTRKNQEFGELKTHYIKPKGKYKFLKPVYLLTNEHSVSAADVLALMMAELENVTIVGENSNGSYSDLYNGKLSNNWQVTLSNQRYLSTTKINYEGVGTPVDIEIKNNLESYQNKNDLILNKAFELINKER